MSNRIEFIKGINITEVTISNGKVLRFNSKNWNRAGNSLQPAMFDILNDYWALQSKVWNTELANLYLECDMLFNNVHGYRALKGPLADLTAKIIAMHDMGKIKEWVHSGKAGCNLAIGEKTDVGSKDRNDLTYFTEDYENILVLSIILKSIIPIWGGYTNAIGSEIDKVNINIKCLELLVNSYIPHCPAYKKLVNYTINLSKDKISLVGFAIVSEIGTDDIIDLLVSLCLIKKVVIFNPRDDGYSIITNIFKLLQDKCKSLNYTKPGKKLDTGDDGSDLTISDTYRIVQPIPPSVAVSVEHFLSDPYKVANSVDSKVTKTAIKTASSVIDKHGEITTIHVIIVSIVLSSAISPPMLRLIDHVSMTKAIIASSVLLRTWGFITLAELLLAVPVEQDMFKVSLSSSAGKVLKDPTKDEYAILAKKYVFMGNVSPGERMLDELGRKVAMRDYSLPDGNMDMVKMELYELLIKMT